MASKLRAVVMVAWASGSQEFSSVFHVDDRMLKTNIAAMIVEPTDRQSFNNIDDLQLILLPILILFQK